MLEDQETIKNAKILFVDDNRENLQVLGMIFKKYDGDLMFARSGKEALAILENHTPDLILLDVMMPEMTGFDTCRLIKADPKIKDIPVIFLTAKADREDIVTGFSAGGVDYITKPFCKEEIIARVTTHLKMGYLHSHLKKSLQDAVLKQEALRLDLDTAANIQRTLLPQMDIDLPGITTAWTYRPCSSVGGDLLNIVPLINNYIAFYVLDVSGHGVPSSLIAVTVAQHLLPHTGNLLRRKEGRVMVVSPADVLTNLDKQFPYERFSKFFTIFYGVLNVESGAMTYSVAGHPPAVLQRTNGEITTLSIGGTVIGAGTGNYEEETIVMNYGDRLFMYTDGITELENAENELFGLARLKGCIKQKLSESGALVLDYISKVLSTYSDGREQEDDISILCVEYSPGTEGAENLLYNGAEIKAHLL